MNFGAMPVLVRRLNALFVACLASLPFLPAHAALHDRGRGLIYDDVLDVTWLQDVNLAKTESFGVSGIGTDGTMNWYTAQSWIAAMNSHDGTGYLGFTDWRLPRVRPVNGSAFVYGEPDPDGRVQPSYTGSADVAFNISAPGSTYPGTTASEVAFLFYNSLGNVSHFPVDGSFVRVGSIWGWTWRPEGGFANGGPFTNWGTARSDIDPPIQPFIWLDALWPVPPGTSCAVNPGAPVTGEQGFDGCSAWVFNVTAGFQAGAGASNFPGSAWAVRDGDVAAIPEPAPYVLFGVGVLAVGASFSRRKRGALASSAQPLGAGTPTNTAR